MVVSSEIWDVLTGVHCLEKALQCSLGRGLDYVCYLSVCLLNKCSSSTWRPNDCRRRNLCRISFHFPAAEAVGSEIAPLSTCHLLVTAATGSLVTVAGLLVEICCAVEMRFFCSHGNRAGGGSTYVCVCVCVDHMQCLLECSCNVCVLVQWFLTGFALLRFYIGHQVLCAKVIIWPSNQSLKCVNILISSLMAINVEMRNSSCLSL